MNLQKPSDHIEWFLKWLLLEDVSQEMENIIDEIKLLESYLDKDYKTG